MDGRMEEGAIISLIDPYNICIVCTCYLILLVYLHVNLQLLSFSIPPVRLLSNVVPLLVPRRNLMIVGLFCPNSCILERCYHYCYSLQHGWPEGHVVLYNVQ
jgi:hypothetical protein